MGEGDEPLRLDRDQDDTLRLKFNTTGPTGDQSTSTVQSMK